MELAARIAKSRVTQIFLGICLAYWGLTLFVDFKYLRELLDAIILVLAIALLFVYVPLASEELLKPRTSRSGRLLLSVVLIWLAMAALRGLSIYGRGFHQLEDIGETPLFGFILWAVMWAAILGIAAPSGEDEIATPYQYRGWIYAGIACGCGIGGFFIGLNWQS